LIAVVCTTSTEYDFLTNFGRLKPPFFFNLRQALDSNFSIPLLHPLKMSFLFGGRSQLSSEQKIAAAETEVEMVSDMFYRSVFRCHLSQPFTYPFYN
jgi:hypothetical protein